MSARIIAISVMCLSIVGLVFAALPQVGYALNIDSQVFATLVAGVATIVGMTAFILWFVEVGPSWDRSLPPRRSREAGTANGATATPEPASASAVARTQLTEAVASAGRRGTLNMAAGIILSVGGSGVLVWLAFDATSSIVPASIPEALNHLVPRVSIAVFLQVLAYFFLRMYGQSIAQISEFQKALTRVEMRFAAYDLAGPEAFPNLQKDILTLIAQYGPDPLAQERASAQSDSAESLSSSAEAVASVIAATVKKLTQ